MGGREDVIVDIGILMVIITLFVLKITNVIKISWLWFLAPIWIPLTLGFLLALIITCVYLIELIKEKRKNERCQDE